MDIPALFIIIFFTICNLSSYVVGLLHPPQYTVFTGAVHYPIDYLYYLSYIAQGKFHWFTSANLFTGEPTGREMLNWLYVFGGHIGSIFRLSPPVIYQLMVILSSILYLIVTYKLTVILVPNNREKQRIFYILFLLSNAFPNMYKNGSSWVFSYFYPWNNIGHPFIRLINVPHHLVIQACIMAAFYCCIAYSQGKKRRYLASLAIVAVLLSSMQPLQWAFLAGVFGISGSIIPVGIFFLFGLPWAIYFKHFFSRPPYQYTITWENLQQIHITFWHFIRLQGPLMILALIGFIPVIRKKNLSIFPLILYSFIAIALFFSPIPQAIHILNLRFFSVILTLTIAYISTEFIWSSRCTPGHAWFLAFIVIVITIPVTARQLYERTVFNKEDVNVYTPIGAVAAYKEAEKVMSEGDTLLIPPLYAPTFTGLTGRRVFAAYDLTTIDFERKNTEITNFFSPSGTPEDKIVWLNHNHITYIIALAWNPVDLPNLQKLFENKYAIVYKVVN